MANDFSKVEKISDQAIAAKEGELILNQARSQDVRQYSFMVGSFQISNTRSLHEDTDYVTISASVGDQHLTKTKFVGNVNNGNHPVNLEIGPFTMRPQDSVTFAYYIVNRGHSSDNSGDTVDKLTGAAGAVLTAVDVPGAGLILEAIDKILKGIFDLVDCDGTVAAEKYTWSRALLDERTQNHPGYAHKQHHHGTDSDVGCGSNSEYDVIWEFHRV